MCHPRTVHNYAIRTDVTRGKQIRIRPDELTNFSRVLNNKCRFNFKSLLFFIDKDTLRFQRLLPVLGFDRIVQL